MTDDRRVGPGVGPADTGEPSAGGAGQRVGQAERLEPEPDPVGTPMPSRMPSPVPRQAPPRSGRGPAASGDLNELLAELLDRTDVVRNVAGRLRALTGAAQALAPEIALPGLLREILETACESVGARYGALGLVGPDRVLTDFLTVGLDEHTVAHAGSLPHGTGLLGQLLVDPRPIRLDDLADTAERNGQPPARPPGHPPMTTFLGVSIRADAQIVGNLYLAEKVPHGSFRDEDEELLTALAALAGAAVRTARAREDSLRRQRWADAASGLVEEILAGAPEPTAAIAGRSRRLAVADLALVLVPDPGGPDAMLVAAANGVGAADMVGRRVPGSAVRATAPEHGSSATVADLALSGAVRIGASTVVPLCAPCDAPVQLLLLARVQGEAGFDPDERALIRAFAAHVGLGIELTRTRRAWREAVKQTGRLHER